MATRLGIIGYGLLGRLMAWQASLRGYQVEVYEEAHAGQHDQTCFAAGGMLAPFSEMDHSEPMIFHTGVASLEIWPHWVSLLGESVDYHQAGSLIIAHPRDLDLWLDFRKKTCRLAQADQYLECKAQNLEPEIQSSLSQALFFPAEQHLEPHSLLLALDRENQKLGVKVYYRRPISHQEIKQNLNLNLVDRCQWLIDCRGSGAKDALPDLRGVRGEALLVQAGQVHISRPIRLLHPRYALYIVPRPRQHYYLGATQIESESLAPITVRSSLELLSAAFAVHTGFADAHVVKSLVGLRPALSHHKPQIQVYGNTLTVNGLFRHGYLLSPVLVETALAFIGQSQSNPFSSELIVHQESDS